MKSLPFKISIASPCPARWEDMGGDDRVRFCDHCRKNVYNISALTTAEAAALLEAKQGHLCARIYQRADGTVLTEDCPVGVARQWRRLKVLVGSGVAVILLALVNLKALGRDGNESSPSNPARGHLLAATEDALSRLGERFGLVHPRSIMGKMRAIPLTAPSLLPTQSQAQLPTTPTPTPAKK